MKINRNAVFVINLKRDLKFGNSCYQTIRYFYVKGASSMKEHFHFTYLLIYQISLIQHMINHFAQVILQRLKDLDLSCRAEGSRSLEAFENFADE